MESIIISPFSQYDPSKNWECYGELICEINKLGIIPMLTGTEKEINLFNKQNWDSKFINLIGLLSITDLIDIISKTDIVITNEGGMAHLCAQLSKKTIVIFNTPTPWRVFRNEHINLYKPTVNDVMNKIKLYAAIR
jgi:ADP-heptose:LPS heptosyltransferase